MESNPVQVNALLAHDDDDDPCDAVVSQRRTFDLTPFLEAYEEAYGPVTSPRPTIILRLTAPGPGEPRSIEVGL